MAGSGGSEGNGDAVEVRLVDVRDAAGAEEAGRAQARAMELWGDVLRTLEVDSDRLAGGGGDAGTRVVEDVRVTGSVRLRREPRAGR